MPERKVGEKKQNRLIPIPRLPHIFTMYCHNMSGYLMAKSWSIVRSYGNFTHDAVFACLRSSAKYNSVLIQQTNLSVYYSTEVMIITCFSETGLARFELLFWLHALLLQ